MSKKYPKFVTNIVFIMSTVNGKAILSQKDFNPVKNWIKENIPKNYNNHGNSFTSLEKNSSSRRSTNWVSYKATVYFENKVDAALFKLFWIDDLK